MAETQWAGVKNTSGDDIMITRNGDPRLFAKDEIAMVDAAYAEFLLGRNSVTSDGRVTTRKYFFRSVPLMEALKHVKEPENRSLAAAKKAAEAEEKMRAALKAEIIAEMRSEQHPQQHVIAGAVARK